MPWTGSDSKSTLRSSKSSAELADSGCEVLGSSFDGCSEDVISAERRLNGIRQGPKGGKWQGLGDGPVRLALAVLVPWLQLQCRIAQADKDLKTPCFSFFGPTRALLLAKWPNQWQQDS